MSHGSMVEKQNEEIGGEVSDRSERHLDACLSTLKFQCELCYGFLGFITQVKGQKQPGTCGKRDKLKTHIRRLPPGRRVTLTNLSTITP